MIFGTSLQWSIIDGEDNARPFGRDNTIEEREIVNTDSNNFRVCMISDTVLLS